MPRLPPRRISRLRMKTMLTMRFIAPMAPIWMADRSSFVVFALLSLSLCALFSSVPFVSFFLLLFCRVWTWRSLTDSQPRRRRHPQQNVVWHNKVLYKFLERYFLSKPGLHVFALCGRPGGHVHQRGHAGKVEKNN